MGLFTKTEKPPGLSEEILSKRVKGHNMKQNLLEAKVIYENWLLTLNTKEFKKTIENVKKNANIMAAQNFHGRAELIGQQLSADQDMAQKELGNGLRSIITKISLIDKLANKCANLEALIAKRFRLVKKRDEKKAKLVRKNKPNTPEFNRLSKEADNAIYDNLELEHEVNAEYDFLINEEESGGVESGLCKSELDFLSMWISSIFCMSKYQLNEMMKSAEAEGKEYDMKNYSESFFQRRKQYVRSNKAKGIQESLKSQGLLMSASALKTKMVPLATAIPEDSVIPVDQEEEEEDGNFDDVILMKGLSNKSTLLSSHDSDMGESKASSQNNLPSYASNASLLSANTDLNDQHAVAEPVTSTPVASTEPVVVTVAAADVTTSSNYNEPKPSANDEAYFNEVKDSGFLIGQREEVVDGKKMEWCEYINRHTGDTFWLESNSFKVSTSQPECFC